MMIRGGGGLAVMAFGSSKDLSVPTSKLSIRTTINFNYAIFLHLFQYPILHILFIWIDDCVEVIKIDQSKQIYMLMVGQTLYLADSV